MKSLIKTHFLKKVLLCFIARFGIIKPNLERAVINITHNCNSHCITCNSWKRESKNEITTKEVINILKQLKEKGIYKLKFSGGEPLLRKDILKLIKISKKIGFKDISLSTNGLLLSNNTIKKLANSGLNEIDLSIDSDSIRGVRGGFKKTMNLLPKLKEFKVSIATMLVKQNLDSMPFLIKEAKKLKIPIYFQLFNNTLYNFNKSDIKKFSIKKDEITPLINQIIKIKKENPWLIKNNFLSLEYAKKYYENPSFREIPCFIGLFNIFIDANANVYAGCWVKPVGNLRKNNLKEIINSKEYKEQLKLAINKKCVNCTCGYPANYHYNLKTLLKDLFY